MDPNDYRIIMSKDWRRGGGVLVNVNLANHKGKFAYFFKLMVTTVDGPPTFLKDPVSTFWLKTQIIHHVRWILYINVNEILVQKRNPALTAFCFWINKYDSGISKI